MTIRYFVRTVRRDGTITLSHPFLLESMACRWARIARRDTEHVARVLVIVRRVQAIEMPDKAA